MGQAGEALGQDIRARTPTWSQIWGGDTAAERLRKQRQESVYAQLEKYAAGELPAGMEEAIGGRFQRIGERGLETMGSQFGRMGMRGPEPGGGPLTRASTQYMTELGQREQETLANLSSQMQMGAMGQLLGQQPETYVPDPWEVLSGGARVAGGKQRWDK